MTLDELYERYSFLEKVLSRDFIFQPGQTRPDFDQAVLSLEHSGAMAFNDSKQVVIRRSLNKHTMFYSQMFEPFLLAYWVACQHLLSLPVDVHGRALPKRPKEMARNVQQLSIRLLEDGATRHYEILSMDLIGNGLSMLADLRTLYTDKRNGEAWISPNNVALSVVACQIGQYIELPSIHIDSFTSTEKSVVVQAKL
jgi:glycerone phosphate O-acyltransferase